MFTNICSRSIEDSAALCTSMMLCTHVSLCYLHVTQQYCSTDCQIAAVTWAAALPAMSPYTRPEALAHAAEAAARAAGASGSTAHSHPSASPPPARAYKRARRRDGKPPVAPATAGTSASGLTAVQQQLERMDISSDHSTASSSAAVTADRKGAAPGRSTKSEYCFCLLHYLASYHLPKQLP
jgi:hypothetical protein